MSPVFISLHPDEGGTVTVNVDDIVAVGPACGEAKGSRVTVRNVRTYDVRDAAERILETVRLAGAILS